MLFWMVALLIDKSSVWSSDSFVCGVGEQLYTNLIFWKQVDLASAQLRLHTIFGVLKEQFKIPNNFMAYHL